MSINPPAVSFEGSVRIGGKGARCQVGQPLTTLFIKECNVEDHADDQDTTNFESGGFDCGTEAIEGCTLDSRGDWDAGLNRFTDVPGSPPGILPRDDLPQRYYINVDDDDYWDFPYTRVLSAKTAIPTRALISFDWSSKSNGPFGRPGE